jgi:raffinose/stachyose/melibiose transport system substrate-binding protein
MKKIVTEFQRSNPGVKINISYSSGQPGQDKIVTQLRANRAADVFYVFPGSGNITGAQPLARNGYLMDLSNRPWVKKVTASDRLLLGINGKVYAAPHGGLGIGYVYNQQAMKAAGLKPPTRWSEVIPFCQAARDKGKVAYAVGYLDKWPALFIPYALTATLVHGPNPTFAQKVLQGKATMASSKWVQALNMTNAMGKAGCFQDSPNGTNYDGSLELVAKGDALGAVGVNNIAEAMAPKAPAGTVFQFAAFPATNNPQQTYVMAGNLLVNAVNAKAKNPALALKFVDYLMANKQMAAIGNATGYVPSFPVAGYKPGVTEKPIVGFQRRNRTTPIIDQWWPNAAVQDSMTAGVQEIAAGRATALDIVKRMDAAFKRKS